MGGMVGEEVEEKAMDAVVSPLTEVVLSDDAIRRVVQKMGGDERYAAGYGVCVGVCFGGIFVVCEVEQ